MKQAIETDTAPKPVGTYSQAIKAGNTVYISGQIPISPVNNTLVAGEFTVEVKQVFENLSAVAKAAGGDLSHIVKLTVYLINLHHFSVVNEIMANYFEKPYPARCTIQVAALPGGARIEVDGIMVTDK